MASIWRNVTIAISFDIAAITVSRNIGRSMKHHARNGRLNCVTRFYLGSLKAPTRGIVRFAFCRCHLIEKNPTWWYAAAEWYAKAVNAPIIYERWRICNVNVHSVVSRERNTQKEIDRNRMKRVAANDPVAIDAPLALVVQTIVLVSVEKLTGWEGTR